MDLQKKKGTGFFVGGIISAVIGAVLIIIGVSVDDDYDRQMRHVFNYGSSDSTGSILRIIGIIVAVLGGLLFIVGIVERATSNRKVETVRALPEVYGIFSSDDGQYEFTIKTDNTCIIKQFENIYYGLLSYCGTDTFDIMIEGFGKAFSIKPVDGSIEVSGGEFDQTLFSRCHREITKEENANRVNIVCILSICGLNIPALILGIVGRSQDKVISPIANIITGVIFAIFDIFVIKGIYVLRVLGITFFCIGSLINIILVIISIYYYNTTPKTFTHD